MMSTPRTELTEEAPADSVNSEADNGSQKSAKVWPSLLPDHWDLAQLKFLCRRSAIYGANIPASEYVSDGVRFLRTTDIDDRGNLTEDDPVFVERAQIEDYLLSDGDLLLSRSGTLGRSFLYRSSRHGECAYAGYLVRFVPGELLNPRFLYFYTKSAGFKVWLARETIESTIGNVSGRKFASLPVPLPPTPEQEDITCFLESRTRRIDDLIAKKERLIELLEEKRTALITQAVTKGLDPDAPMKDSGLEWLGEMPRHWEVIRISRILEKLIDFRGQTPKKLGLDWGGTIPAISAGNVRDGYLDIDPDGHCGDEQLYRRWMTSGNVRKGDLLFTTEAPLGNVALVPDDRRYILSQRVLALRTRTSLAQSSYLFHLFRSRLFKQRLQRDATGSTAEGISQSKFSMLRVCVPPLSEQQFIVSFLRERFRPITELEERAQTAITRLREYRSALVTAAVTGKIDVRDHAA